MTASKDSTAKLWESPERQEGEGDIARARGRGVRAGLRHRFEGQDDQDLEALRKNCNI
jgi:hypothetical protein